MNDFFNQSGAPSPKSSLSSSVIRAEIYNIAQGFDKLPRLLNKNNYAVFVNSGGSGLESKTPEEARALIDALSEEEVAALLALKANLASPALTGNPTAPTQTVGDDSTKIATTAFVSDAVEPKSNIISPAFSGIPTAPTAAAGTDSTQIATTAFIAALGALKANIASPVFTGNPTAPTPATSDNDTSIATTAFIKNLIAANNTYSSGANGIAMHNSDTNLLICYKSVGGTSLNIATGALYRTDNIGLDISFRIYVCSICVNVHCPGFVSCMVCKCDIIHKWFCRMGNKPKCTNDFRLFNCYRN